MLEQRMRRISNEEEKVESGVASDFEVQSFRINCHLIVECDGSARCTRSDPHSNASGAELVCDDSNTCRQIGRC